MTEIRPETIIEFSKGPAELVVAEARNLVRIRMDHRFALEGVELLGDSVDEKVRAELEGAIVDAFKSAMQQVLEKNIIQLRTLAENQNAGAKAR